MPQTAPSEGLVGVRVLRQPKPARAGKIPIKRHYFAIENLNTRDHNSNWPADAVSSGALCDRSTHPGCSLSIHANVALRILRIELTLDGACQHGRPRLVHGVVLQFLAIRRGLRTENDGSDIRFSATCYSSAPTNPSSSRRTLSRARPRTAGGNGAAPSSRHRLAVCLSPSKTAAQLAHATQCCSMVSHAALSICGDLRKDVPALRPHDLPPVNSRLSISRARRRRCFTLASEYPVMAATSFVGRPSISRKRMMMR